MRAQHMLLTVTCILPSTLAAQEATVIPLASEPHHHLALHNEYVNVYQVEVASHDSVLLHRHDVDALSIMMSDSQVTVRSPGKPDVHQKLADGQLRLQPRGLVHSTSIDSDTTYRNVTVELLLPQQGERNLCAPVIASQPLNCLINTPVPTATNFAQPQFETDQTTVTLIRVRPHQDTALHKTDGPELVVALDSVVVAFVSEKEPERLLHPGDFVWLDKDRSAQLFRNRSDKEVRLISLAVKP